MHLVAGYVDVPGPIRFPNAVLVAMSGVALPSWKVDVCLGLNDIPL